MAHTTGTTLPDPEGVEDGAVHHLVVDEPTIAEGEGAIQVYTFDERAGKWVFQHLVTPDADEGPPVFEPEGAHGDDPGNADADYNPDEPDPVPPPEETS